jgi:hypothetical protein
MPAKPPIYRRLPARSFGFFQNTSLWLGADHLLFVRIVPGGESYRRFFFSDIQAFIIRRTAFRLWANAVFLALAALNLLPLFALAADDAEMHPVAYFALGSAVWLALAIANTLRGPACQTCVQTAVQTVRVGALGRVRTTNRVLDMLRPRLLGAQTAAVGPTGGEKIPVDENPA